MSGGKFGNDKFDCNLEFANADASESDCSALLGNASRLSTPWHHVSEKLPEMPLLKSADGGEEHF